MLHAGYTMDFQFPIPCQAASEGGRNLTQFHDANFQRTAAHGAGAFVRP
jgi:hypothetical protein